MNDQLLYCLLIRVGFWQPKFAIHSLFLWCITLYVILGCSLLLYRCGFVVLAWDTISEFSSYTKPLIKGKMPQELRHRLQYMVCSEKPCHCIMLATKMLALPLLDILLVLICKSVVQLHQDIRGVYFGCLWGPFLIFKIQMFTQHCQERNPFQLVCSRLLSNLEMG